MGEKKKWKSGSSSDDDLPDEKEARGQQDDEAGEENKYKAVRERERERIALSVVFTGIRDGIVACPVPMRP